MSSVCGRCGAEKIATNEYEAKRLKRGFCLNPQCVKACARCGEEKPMTAYTHHIAYCQPCSAAWKREARKLRPPPKEDPLHSRDRNLRQNYGISQAQYMELLQLQGGVCAICGKAETRIDPRTRALRFLSVDHSHVTGRVRALLCNVCNNLLGQLEQDETRIFKMLDYLRKHNAIDGIQVSENAVTIPVTAGPSWD